MNHLVAGLLPDLYNKIGKDSDGNVKFDGLGDVLQLLANLIQVILTGAGIASVIFIIVGGIMYIASLGDPSRTTKAKETIYYSIVGLVISLAAYGIVRFITESFS